MLGFSNYNYAHFSRELLHELERSPFSGPRPGEHAPDFKATTLAGVDWLLDAQNIITQLDPYVKSAGKSAVDGKHWESEFRQRDGEHGDDADVDADFDWNVAGDSELSCDHWCWLYDRRGQFAGNTEPDTIADPSGAVPADLDWDSQWADHDKQRFLDRLYGRGGSERYEHSGTESAVDGERWESEFWQRDGEHGNDTDVDADIDRNCAGNG